jgi:hypothetical protein
LAKHSESSLPIPEEAPVIRTFFSLRSNLPNSSFPWSRGFILNYV